MAKHARTTITVPPDLKARMEAVEEPVNWSAIACQAFEQRLADITRRRGAKDMRQVVQRLKASRDRVGSDRYREGSEAGKAWAMSHAEADELARLSDLYETHERDGSGWDGFFTGGGAYSPAERLAFVILGEEREGDRSTAAEFWERYADVSPSRRRQEGDLFDDFVRGFVDGALGIWDEVKDEL
jgi:hypothetical protein